MPTPETPAVNDNELLEDVSLPFLIEKNNIRGRFIRLTKSVDKIIRSHQYPEPVSQLLSEMLILTAMIGSTLKTEGIITLQLQGEGPVNFAVADYTHTGHLRGYANIKEEHQEEIKEKATIQELVGNGYLVITLENNHAADRHQGIVKLEGTSLTDCITSYFEKSVQRDTTFRIATIHTKSGRRKKSWYAGGIMLQRIPEEGGTKENIETMNDNINIDAIVNWGQGKKNLDNISLEDLYTPSQSLYEILSRQFGENKVRVFSATKLIARCRCSRKKVSFVLKNMSKEELNGLKNKEGKIIAKCQFCGKEQKFDDKDIEKWVKG